MDKHSTLPARPGGPPTHSHSSTPWLKPFFLQHTFLLSRTSTQLPDPLSTKVACLSPCRRIVSSTSSFLNQSAGPGLFAPLSTTHSYHSLRVTSNISSFYCGLRPRHQSLDIICSLLALLNSTPQNRCCPLPHIETYHQKPHKSKLGILTSTLQSQIAIKQRGS